MMDTNIDGVSTNQYINRIIDYKNKYNPKSIVIFGKKYRWVLIIILVGWYFLLPSKSSTIDINGLETMTAWSGQIKKIISAQGKVSIPQSLKLFFLKSWKVSRIFVKEWQQVKAWDLIAEIDTTDAMINLQQAQTNLAIARSKLNNLKQWPDLSTNIELNNQISQAENNKNLTKIQLDILKSEKDKKEAELKQQLNQLSGEIMIANSEYNNLVLQSWDDLSDQISNYNNQIKNAIQQYQSAQIKITDLIDKYDTIFGISKNYESLANTVYLWGKNSNSLVSVKNELLKIITKSKSIETLNLPTTIDSDTYDILTLKQKYDTFQNFVKDIQLRSANAYISINNSIVSVKVLDQSDIDNYKNTVIQGNSTLDSVFSTLQNNYEKITSIKTRNQITIDLQNEILNKKNSIEKLHTQYVQIANQYLQNGWNYNEQIVNKENTILQQDGQISYTNQKLNELTDFENIRQQQLEIQMQSLNVLQAKKDLKDYQIVAPFDGSVDEIDFQLYQQISSTNYITLTNPSIYRIEVGLDQVDIVSIHIWQPVTITLAPFPDTPLTGIVEQIYNTPVTTNNSLSYTVAVSYQSSKLNILEWMFGTVDFEIGKENTWPIVTIPLKAIQYDTWSSTPFVWIKQWTWAHINIIKKNINLWLTDGNQIQVSSGIILGDEIVVSAYTPQTIEKKQFWPRWWWGR